MSIFQSIFIRNKANSDNVSVTDGALHVLPQDQSTEPIDAVFNQSVSNFTLSSDTVASGVTTLEYDFNATAGHGIVVSDEVLLLDVVGDRAFQAVVVGVAANVITVDRPIDYAFPSATALGRIVISDMAVDGSVTPQIFTFRAGTSAVDVTRLFLTALDTTAMDFSTFMGQAALTNGLVLRIINGFQKTIFTFKTNRDIAQFCFDVNLEARAPAGQHGFSCRIGFAGTEKHGVAIRLSGDEVLQWVVQDDLSGLIVLTGSVEGHKTIG